MEVENEQSRLPVATLVAAQVEAAASGSAAAYDWLRERFHAALVGVIVWKTGWEHRHAREAARACWEEAREQILRPPGKGGYRADGDGQFHYYIWNRCLSWSPPYEQRLRSQPFDPDSGDRGVPGELADENQPRPDAVQLASERARSVSEAMFLLLELLFRAETGYPHQQLAFGFSKLVYGQPSPRGMHGDPHRTAAAHAATRLQQLAEEFAAAYADGLEGGLETRPRVLRALDPLRARLPLRVCDLVKADRESASQCAAFADHAVGATALRDYFGAWQGNGVKAITNWANRIKSRLERGLGRAGVATEAQLLEQMEKAPGPARSPSEPAI